MITGDAHVTVILPLKAFHPVLLQKAIGSILEQTDPLWRMVVVVEDADVPQFKERLADALADARVELTANHRRGFPGAINTGVDHARTPFVALLLADDMWAPEAVAVLNERITAFPEVDFFHSSRRIIGEQDEPLSAVYRARETWTVDNFRWGSPVKHLLCWRKSRGLAAGGIDEAMLKAQDDYDFPWTMAEQGAAFKAVPECLYIYRNHLMCERLTTHRPLSVTKRGVLGILRKHGVGPLESRVIIAMMRLSSSLGGQCVYRNGFDRWIKTRIRYDVRRGWRQQTYR